MIQVRLQLQLVLAVLVSCREAAQFVCRLERISHTLRRDEVDGDFDARVYVQHLMDSALKF